MACVPFALRVFAPPGRVRAAAPGAGARAAGTRADRGVRPCQRIMASSDAPRGGAGRGRRATLVSQAAAAATALLAGSGMARAAAEPADPETSPLIQGECFCFCPPEPKSCHILKRCRRPRTERDADATTPRPAELLRRTEEHKAERVQERLDDYNRRNYADYFKVTDKGTFRGEMSENDIAIREQLRKWGDK